MPCYLTKVDTCSLVTAITMEYSFYPDQFFIHSLQWRPTIGSHLDTEAKVIVLVHL